MSVSWGSIRVEDLIGPVNGTLLSGPVEKRPAGLGTDSRSIRAGELFWCLIGENFDGHDFLADAIEKGACAAVVQHDRFSREMTFTRHEAGRSGSGSKEPAIIAVDDSLEALGDLARWWRKNHSAGVLAVTGSSGKTTVKEMSASILSVEGNVLKSRGNYNNLIGLPLTIFDLCEAHDKVVLEMGMNRPGEIGRLTEIADPDAGLILNVGMAHLEGLGDIRGVAEAKTEMLSKMSGQATPIINRDDSLLFETAVSVRKDLITFGMGRKNDFRATNVKDFGTGGLSFDLHLEGRVVEISLKVPGVHNVYNALAASAAASVLGEKDSSIRKGLASFCGVPGRFNLVQLSRGNLMVDDCYNSNPSSLRSSIGSLSTIKAGYDRLLVGLGEMMELGEAAIRAHRDAGRLVGGIGASHFFVTGEHAGEMARGALETGMPEESVWVFDSLDEMTAAIRSNLGKNALVFLKGSNRTGLSRVADDLKTLEGGEEARHGKA